MGAKEPLGPDLRLCGSRRVARSSPTPLYTTRTCVKPFAPAAHPCSKHGAHEAHGSPKREEAKCPYVDATAPELPCRPPLRPRKPVEVPGGPVLVHHDRTAQSEFTRADADEQGTAADKEAAGSSGQMQMRQMRQASTQHPKAAMPTSGHVGDTAERPGGG